MKVSEVMNRDVGCCTAECNLSEATEILWKKDASALPVVDAQGKVVGLLTDRDVAIAAGTRNVPASHIAVRSVINSNKPFTCSPEDDVQKALETMRTRHVRRLPVVERDGTLRGLLSISDVVFAAGRDERGRPGVTPEEFLKTYRGIKEIQNVPRVRSREAEPLLATS